MMRWICYEYREVCDTQLWSVERSHDVAIVMSLHQHFNPVMYFTFKSLRFEKNSIHASAFASGGGGRGALALRTSSSSLASYLLYFATPMVLPLSWSTAFMRYTVGSSLMALRSASKKVFFADSEGSPKSAARPPPENAPK